MGGAELAEAFHRDVVGPLLARSLPSVSYAAARLGSGSDVLGLDDAMSRDHDWGCRLTVLVDAEARAAVPHIQRLLADNLPDSYAGFPVRFPVTWDPTETHKVEVATVADFAASRLGVEPSTMDELAWLVVSGQGVLEVVGGKVFIDATRDLAPLRDALRWYPPDVDRFVVASAWHQLGERLQMVGRTGMTGQDLQSRLITARLVDTLIHLAFLVHRSWMPYAKWREARFRALPDADRLGDLFTAALGAEAWQEREAAISEAAELLLAAQHQRGLPGPARAVVSFHDRPFRTIDESVVRLLRSEISSEALRRLPALGGTDQWVDNDEILSNGAHRAAAGAAYQALLRATVKNAGAGRAE